MNPPGMESSNIISRLMAQVDALAAQVRELRAASGTLNQATIYKGDLRVTAGGSLLIDGGGGITAKDLGMLRFLHDNDVRALYMGPLFNDVGGAFAGRGLLVQGSDASDVFRASSDGPGPYSSVVTVGSDPSASGTVDFFGAYSDVIVLSAPALDIYGIPTTGAAANLTFGMVGSTRTVAVSVSSERYKTDVADLEVDIDDLLALTGITWVHNDAMDTAPEGPISRNVGWSAERMDALPSLRQFVNYDEHGRPDSVEDARVAGATHELAKHSHARVLELEAAVSELKGTVSEQADQIAALTARLDAVAPILSADDTQE